MTPSEFRAARKRLGLTVPELAGALEVSTRSINRYGSEGAPKHIALALKWLEHGAQKDG
jgi:DNA-binding transcriptional regulator YiaG